MTDNSVKDVFRRRIVEKSIQILRKHEKSDKEIKEMLLKDFSIQEEALDKLLAKP